MTQTPNLKLFGCVVQGSFPVDSFLDGVDNQEDAEKKLALTARLAKKVR